MRRFNLALCATISLCSAGSLLAQHEPADDVDLSNAPLETKREWVRTQMVREFASGLDSEKLKKIDDTVANMSQVRIDQLVKNYAKRQQSQADAQTQDARLAEQRDEAYRQALIAGYQARLAAARAGGNPGFAPLITTLPSGASLGASAVVSPDRRYVRMSLTPFFSSVGPVQTFTFANPVPYRPQYAPQRQRRGVPWRP
jgi:hypothetical protein